MPWLLVWLLYSQWKCQTALLAVQELHDWLQDIVSILGHTAGIPHIRSSFHLSQDVAHLLHIFFDVRLKTIVEKMQLCVTYVWQKSMLWCLFVCGCESMSTWQQRPCSDHPWHCWASPADLSEYRWPPHTAKSKGQKVISYQNIILVLF